jgi:hypothetical protein
MRALPMIQDVLAVAQQRRETFAAIHCAAAANHDIVPMIRMHAIIGAFSTVRAHATCPIAGCGTTLPPIGGPPLCPIPGGPGWACGGGASTITGGGGGICGIGSG